MRDEERNEVRCESEEVRKGSRSIMERKKKRKAHKGMGSQGNTALGQR